MSSANTRQWWRLGLIAAAAIALTVIFSLVLAPGFDVNRVFYPAVRAVWQAQPVYATVELFTNPPWVLLPLLPWGWLSPALLHGALVTATLLAMFWVMRDYARCKWSYPLAVISMPFLAMLWVGQIEVFSLLGVMVSYRAAVRRSIWGLALGLLLMLIKPQETWVVILLVVVVVARQWRPVPLAKTALLVIGVALVTSLLFGFGWLDRILRGPSYASGWQNFSLWQWSQSVPQIIVIGVWIAIAVIAIVALRRAGLSRQGLALAAVCSNLLSPYLTGPHLLVTLCFGWGLLLDESIGWGTAAYLASLTPLLRLTTGNQALNSLDLIFPLVVFVGLLVRQFRAVMPLGRQVSP